MKKQFTIFLIILFLLCISFANSAYAETEVSGNITSDTTWVSVNSPYNILDTLQVFNGATLTIQEGVEVKTGKSKIIKIAGALIVNGTNINPVIFSSLGIDKWQGIEFIDSNNSQINNSIIENAGVAIDLKGISEVPMMGNIFRNNTWVITDTHGYQRMYFVNNTVYDNGDVFYGIRTSGNDNVFRNNTFRNNSSVFHHGYYTNNTTIDNNNFINNVFVIRGPEQGFGYGTVSIANNWWNTTDTNLIDNLINDKNDDIALQLLDYLPNKTSEVEGIGSSVSLTISASQNTCTSWTYSNWSACQSNNTQSRSLVSSSPSGCTGGNPVLTQSCTYTPPACTSWTYSTWGSCVDSQQNRTITSSQPASCVGGNSILSQSCNATPLCTENNWTSTLAPTDCPNNGQQTKRWTKTGQCQGGVSRSAEETISCNYQASTCTSFVYSDWGICNTSGVQSRTTLSTSPSGCTGGNPVLSQNCNYNSGEILNKDSIIETKDNLSVSSTNQNTQKITEQPKNNQRYKESTIIESVESSPKIKQEQNNSVSPKNEFIEKQGKENKKENGNNTDTEILEQRRSLVAETVQEIVKIADSNIGIGQQVKVIAQTQVQNQEKLEINMKKIQSRSGLAKFFVGSDYGEIKSSQELLEQNKKQIRNLKQLGAQLSKKDDQRQIAEQIKFLEQANQQMETSLNEAKKGFSLFGWAFRSFAK